MSAMQKGFYKGYEYLARDWRGQFKGRAFFNKKPVIDVEADSIEEAVELLKLEIANRGESASKPITPETIQLATSQVLRYLAPLAKKVMIKLASHHKENWTVGHLAELYSVPAEDLYQVLIEAEASIIEYLAQNPTNNGDIIMESPISLEGFIQNPDSVLELNEPVRKAVLDYLSQD